MPNTNVYLAETKQVFCTPSDLVVGLRLVLASTNTGLHMGAGPKFKPCSQGRGCMTYSLPEEALYTMWTCYGVLC